MNILNKIADILQLDTVKKGYMPATPDVMIGLYEYTARPPDQYFGATGINQSVQARCRAPDAETAYQMAKTVCASLNRYHDAELTTLQSTPILDIGRDDAGRQEYTVNFEIRRY